GNNTGTFRIYHNTIHKRSGEAGGFSIIRKEYGEDALIQCTYSNLVVYRKKKNLWELSNIVQNHSDLYRFIEEDPYGNLWASHLYHGLFRLRLSASLDSVIFVKKYTAEIPVKNHTINVFKVENRIIFTSGFTIFTYDDINDTITEYKALSEPLGRFAAANQFVPAPDHQYWLITDNKIGLFSIYGNEVKLIKSFPNELFNNELVKGFENLCPLQNNQAILCLENGYALLDANIHPENFPIMQQIPLVSQLKVSNLNGNESKLPPADDDFTLKANWNNLTVRFAFPYYTCERLTYAYKIEGLDNDWSEGHANPDFHFQRLPTGTYTLNVKATDSWGHSSRVAKLHFEVLPPWYLSTFARIIYVILLALFLILYRYNVVRKTKLKEKKIQESRERELIRLRNEKLQAEVTHKSKELANSTMSIIKKNEFLLELKNTLRRQKLQLGTRFPDKYYATLVDKIDRNIVNKDDWNVFEMNFERAHEQFLNKIKKTYPELTASDLRLCAYLRMNLTSKDIAPLLGISVRGVENHRYRLRKKMEVSNDESLTDFILSL
ncbi:MAG TPA: triple tyrosine motif-containing protein, partial [Bacteroidales bacterium]|nr:triple tyrosine motif-containing protein [Bacteroidales bacterium]